LAEDQRAMRPGTGERDIKMIAAGLGGKTAVPRRTGRAVYGDPVAELRRRTFEMALGGLRVIPDVMPDAVNEHTHDLLLFAPVGHGSCPIHGPSGRARPAAIR